MSNPQTRALYFKIWAVTFVLVGLGILVAGAAHVWQRYQRIGSFDRISAMVVRTWDECRILRKVSKNKSEYDSTVPCDQVEAAIAVKELPKAYSYKRYDNADLEYAHGGQAQSKTVDAGRIPPEQRKSGAVVELFVNPRDASDIETRLHSGDYKLMALLAAACMLAVGGGLWYLRRAYVRRPSGQRA